MVNANSEDFFTCDGSCNDIHEDCSGISAMHLKGPRTLKYICTVCENGFQLLPIIEKKLSKLYNMVNNLSSESASDQNTTSNINVKSFIKEYEDCHFQ